jgi:hypothetical protein
MHLSSGFERLTIYLRASMKLPHLIKTSATKSGSALVPTVPNIINSRLLSSDTVISSGRPLINSNRRVMTAFCYRSANDIMVAAALSIFTENQARGTGRPPR